MRNFLRGCNKQYSHLQSEKTRTLMEMCGCTLMQRNTAILPQRFYHGESATASPFRRVRFAESVSPSPFRRDRSAETVPPRPFRRVRSVESAPSPLHRDRSADTAPPRPHRQVKHALLVTAGFKKIIRIFYSIK